MAGNSVKGTTARPFVSSELAHGWQPSASNVDSVRNRDPPSFGHRLVAQSQELEAKS